MRERGKYQVRHSQKQAKRYRNWWRKRPVMWPSCSRRDSKTLAMCDDHRREHPNLRANRSYRRTPRSACAHTHASPRTRLRQGQHDDENQARANHDFRFHGILVIQYIYAHDPLSCNTDCCRLLFSGCLRRWTGRRQKPFTKIGLGFARLGCRSPGPAACNDG